MKRVLAITAAAALAAAGCFGGDGASPAPQGSSAPKALQVGAEIDVAPVTFNLDAAPLGVVQAVTELGDDVVVFGDQGMFLLSGGKISASDASVKGWRSAATIPAPDGTGPWAVGVGADGHVYRVRARTSLEDVSDRFGLAADQVTAVTTLGPTRTVFATKVAVVVIEAGKATRFDTGPLDPLATARDRVAGIAEGQVVVVDVAAQTKLAMPLPGVRALALDANGKVLAQTEHELFEESDGRFVSIYARNDATLHGLAATPTRTWLGIGDRLASIEGGTLHVAKPGVALAADSALVGNPDGDVWALSASGLVRAGVPVGAAEKAWKDAMLPIYVRVCSQCHAPGGTSGIDLSAFAAWDARRAVIRERVVVQKNMPAGQKLAAEDLAAIDKWTSGQ